MKTILALLMLIAVVVVSFFLIVVIGSLAIASANSWIIGGNFSDAWDLCMENKFIVFAWAALFFSVVAIGTRQNKRY